MEERPPALTRTKPRPVPAPDESVDPVSAMMEKQPVAPVKKRPRQEVVFNFSTRLSQEAYDTLYGIVDANPGMTVREATENAILGFYKK